MAHFAFLRAEWPTVSEAAEQAESLVHSDARAACFYARRGLELLVAWLYRHEAALTQPYQDHLAALIHEPCFRNVVGNAVFQKARIIKDLGNLAVHSHKPIKQFDALTAVRELFHITYWLGRTYGRAAKPPDGLTFQQEALQRGSAAPAQTQDQLQALEARLREKDKRLAEAVAAKAAVDDELTKLREEVAEARRANASLPDTHDYSEAETRDYFIDLLLREAGWPLDQKRDTEFEVDGMPNNEKKGYVDYVLWGDDGKPLALVEAKRTKKDPKEGIQQARLYADCLEKQCGRRPAIFCSNGYDHWLWDDTNYPPRPVQGFYKKPELDLLIQRRDTRKPLSSAVINKDIVERHYQVRAIRRIGETFEKDKQRKALVVMATGAGKTRTVIALADVLMRCNWAKRVLFLADRVALVNQAVNAFKKHLPDSSPVNLVTQKDGQGRVYVSTYPTMMGLIDETRGGERRFGVGHFDLIVIDEAHRSVFQKYRAIFDYFDSLLVGLTATPKDEVDKNTYSLFELETGVPTDAYSLEEAVKDKYLVPPKGVSVPLKFLRQGIRYADLSEQEKDEWDSLEWDEVQGPPAAVDPVALVQWLFNKDTVDKVLEHLMTHGLKVAGGDRLGKTIIFAKNNAHAEFIAERFDANYPHLKGEFSRVVTFKTVYAQTLINDFSQKEKAPHIAISVDMLDTGIDVPEVVNLVFFKMVRSKTKFWQMVGRGTRLCSDLLGPDQHKQYFFIFDYCQNLEFFNQDLPAAQTTAGAPLGTRLFRARVALVTELDSAHRHAGLATAAAEPTSKWASGAPSLMELRADVAEGLRGEVAAMNPANFVVRPKRALVEKYGESDAWKSLAAEAVAELSLEVAGLPTEKEAEPEEPKRFDLLILRLQLALLRQRPEFALLRDQVRKLADLLAEKPNIPMIAAQMELIQEIQGNPWWEGVTVGLLEVARKRLRGLMGLIDKVERKPIYTDFEDELGAAAEVDLPEISGADPFERFRIKARLFLSDHKDHITIAKLRRNEPLTKADLQELERILVASGVGGPGDIKRAADEAAGLGLFVRSLVGLDREAAKRALGRFLDGTRFAANQIEFANLVVDQLTERGVMDAALLYESPFTDVAPTGPDGLYKVADVEDLVAILEEVKDRADAVAERG